MEKSIDRTSYRRSNKSEEKKEDTIENKSFSYLKIFLNQTIVSLLIIIFVIAAQYLDLEIVENWISKNLSGGYEIDEVFCLLKNKVESYKNKLNTIAIASGDESNNDIEKNESGESSGESSGEASGEIVLQTAVEGVNQLAEDAKFVTDNYDFVWPLKGTITSKFGCRVSDSNIVSSYHTGLDIAANSGTNIVAAHGGTVTLSKAYSSYGNCIMIEDGELLTLYAHCSVLSVKEGQNVKEGDIIGKVGMTGNATGPHLHFEIRYQGRYINPQDVLGNIQ